MHPVNILLIFVFSYKNSDVTIENLKQACQAHFSSKGLMEKGTAIDILAGEP
jgi:hypothetical protein